MIESRPIENPEILAALRGQPLPLPSPETETEVRAVVTVVTTGLPDNVLLVISREMHLAFGDKVQVVLLDADALEVE